MLIAQVPEVYGRQSVLFNSVEGECTYSKLLMVIDVLPRIAQKH